MRSELSQDIYDKVIFLEDRHNGISQIKNELNLKNGSYIVRFRFNYHYTRDIILQAKGLGLFIVLMVAMTAEDIVICKDLGELNLLKLAIDTDLVESIRRID